ncbi:hypothetical protein HY639_04620 [Candidatus Woesearchaeota archaeon]|nr:hypothetical protein [Candidatus Woesearchaeota archaeon]
MRMLLIALLLIAPVLAEEKLDYANVQWEKVSAEQWKTFDWQQLKSTDNVPWDTVMKLVEKQDDAKLPTAETNEAALKKVQEKMQEKLGLKSLDLQQATSLRFKQGKIVNGDVPLPTLPEKAQARATAEGSWQITLGKATLDVDKNLKDMAGELSVTDKGDALTAQLGDVTAQFPQEGTAHMSKGEKGITLQGTQPFTANGVNFDKASLVDVTADSFTLKTGKLQMQKDGDVLASFSQPGTMTVKSRLPARLQLEASSTDSSVSILGHTLQPVAGKPLDVTIGGTEPNHKPGLVWISKSGEEFTVKGSGIAQLQYHDKQKNDYFMLDVPESTQFTLERAQKPLTTAPVTFDYKVTMENPLANGHVGTASINGVSFTGKKNGGFFIEQADADNYYPDMKYRMLDIEYQDKQHPALNRQLSLTDDGVVLRGYKGYTHAPNQLQTYNAIAVDVEARGAQAWKEMIEIKTADKPAAERLLEMTQVKNLDALTSTGRRTMHEIATSLAKEAGAEHWTTSFSERVASLLPSFGYASQAKIASRKQAANTFVQSLEQGIGDGVDEEMLTRARVKPEDVIPEPPRQVPLLRHPISARQPSVRADEPPIIRPTIMHTRQDQNDPAYRAWNTLSNFMIEPEASIRNTDAVTTLRRDIDFLSQSGKPLGWYNRQLAEFEDSMTRYRDHHRALDEIFPQQEVRKKAQSADAVLQEIRKMRQRLGKK